MWPGREGASNNHNRGYCSDGVLQKAKKIDKQVGLGGQTETVIEILPPYPQPHGIFTRGSDFHPDVFLNTVSDMYDHVVVRGDSGGPLSMEYLAFAELLHKRVKVMADGAALFELYASFNTVLPRSSAALVVEKDGIQYLRVDRLAEASGTADT